MTFPVSAVRFHTTWTPTENYDSGQQKLIPCASICWPCMDYSCRLQRI